MVQPNFDWVTKNLQNADVGPRDAPNAMAWNVLQFLRSSPENKAAFLFICSLIWPSKNQPASATPDQFPDLTDEELDQEFQKEWDRVVFNYEHRAELLAAESA
jgi:hypothetical protein